MHVFEFPFALPYKIFQVCLKFFTTGRDVESEYHSFSVWDREMKNEI